MEFIVSSSVLLGQLNTIKSVINSKNSLPILDNFLFTLSEGNLKIEATDLETRLETTVALDSANGSGVFSIPAKKMTEILSLFADEPLTCKVDLDAFQIELTSSSGKFSIPCVSGEDFPRIQPLNDEKKASITMPSDVLQKGIAKTVFATSDDESHPVMTSVLFELAEDHIRFVATDAHLLARYTRTDVKVETPTTFNFPKKSANLLKSILAKDGNDVVIEYDDKQVVIKMTSYIVTCRVIDGKYPNYSAVIPKENPNVMTVNKEDFFRKLRRVSYFSDATFMVRLSMSGSQLVISARDSNKQESANETMSCVFEGAESMEIGVRAKFLMNELDNIDSEDIRLEMSDPNKPILVMSCETGEENEDVLMLVMPIML